MSQPSPDFRTVLVTRPGHQAAGLMTALSLRGYVPVSAPVLEMHACDMAIPEGDFDALAFTSANGVAAFAAREVRRDIPVFAVGPSTAAAARKAQFQKIVSGEADAAALAGLIANALPQGAHVLYPSARDIAFNLDHALSAARIRTTRVVVYEMKIAAALPKAALEAISEGCVALFHSARSLSAFAGLAHGAGASLENVLAVQIGGHSGDDVPAGLNEVLHLLGPGLGEQAVVDFLDRLEARRSGL